MVARLVGAGILCFAWNPLDHNWYVLLGRERYVPGWRQGSCRWADFGGGAHNDENAEETAAREFVEETCNVVPFFKWDKDDKSKSGRCMSSTDIIHALQENSYASKLVVFRKNGKRKQVLFMKQINFDAGLPLKFEKVRSVLDVIAKRSALVTQLQDRLPKRHPFLRNGMIRKTDDEYEIVDDITGVHFDGKDLKVDCTIEKPLHGVIKDVQYVLKMNRNDVGHAKDYVCWFDEFQQLLEAYKTLPLQLKQHPAFHIQRWKHHIVKITVNPDFLEKDMIGWWRVNDLKKIVGLSYSVDRDQQKRKLQQFRPHFLQQLKLCLSRWNR